MISDWICEATSALQCSYILNSVRFRTDSNSVRKTNLKNFYKIFRTELDSVRKQKNIFKPRKKFRTKFNSVWKKSCNILERENSESNWNRFGKIYNISEKMTHLLTYDSAYLIIRSTAHHLYQHQNHQHQHFSESSTSIGIRWQTNC